MIITKTLNTLPKKPLSKSRQISMLIVAQFSLAIVFLLLLSACGRTTTTTETEFCQEDYYNNNNYQCQKIEKERVEYYAR